jgi:hypothetical protein
MNREWLTLAFGVGLVSAVVVVSVWQNYPDIGAETDPAPVETAEPITAEPAPASPVTRTPPPATAPAPATAPPPSVPAPARLDARVSVVHKHRLGDCEGTLRAVPGTLSYTTTHEGDGFRMALSEIEEFDLDVEKKNLRIRRGGRTWNFTTRSDSAAALSAFHKEVTRAKK